MKIGSVPYVNSKPLTRFLNTSVERQVPAELAESLLNDKIDVALLPVYTAIRHNLKMYPEAGIIGANGRVDSVGLFTRPFVEDLHELHSVYLDQESQTSTYLAKIILKKFYNHSLYDLEFFHHDNRAMADAQMLIGDKALFFDHNKNPHKYWDLGEIWKEQTGTGFMFACWASKRDLSDSEVTTLAEAKEQGLQNMDQIVAEQDPSHRAIIENYLKNRIVYQSSPDIKNGLKFYKEYLAEYEYSSPLPKTQKVA